MKLLNKNHFSAFIRWQLPEQLNNNREAVCIVQLAEVDFGVSPAYAKFYDVTKQPKALINECVGYLVAKSWGFDVPESAAIVFLPLRKLSLTKSGPNAEWLKKIAKTRDTYPAFCSSALMASPPAFVFKGDLDLIRQDVAMWPHLGAAIALDHVIANTDRHFGNLLRRAKGAYSLIDHGRLFNEDAGNWSLKDVSSARKYRNRLAELMLGTVDKLVDKAIAAAGSDAAYTGDGLNYIPAWCADFVTTSEYQHLKTVLLERAALAESVIPVELGQQLC
jgi:hypothetical protein